MAASILKSAFPPIYKAVMSIYHLLPLSHDPPSIRLIELELDGDGASKIYSKMDTYKIPPRFEYDALSYTWGTEHNLMNIDINGYDCPVTPNLHDALQQFCLNQHKNGVAKRKLWIDAICIHQADNAEKSSQLMLMKDIYAGASNVLAWLGKPDGLTELAFDTLERFAAADGTQDGSATYRDILHTADERRAAIDLFIRRPYFDRVWIIQEIVVAKKATVFCGPFSMTFDKLYLACQRMTGSGFFPFSAQISKLTYLGDWRGYFQKMDGYEREEAFDLKVFIDSRDKSATDPRDKVYALRGIANSVIVEGITVDYNNSVERVYTDLAKHLLKAQPGLRVLSAVVLQHRKYSTLHLPSWVPDWSQRQWGGGILQKYYRFAPSKLFKAGGIGKSRVIKAEDSETICLEGIRLDTVKSISPVKSILMDKENNKFVITETKLREMATEATSQEIYPFTGEMSWKAFFRTLTADRSALSTRIHEEYRAKFFSAFRDWNLSHPHGDPPDELPAAAWAEISKTLGAIIEDKIMFITDRGYLGLGQEGSKVGDVVCILCGGETPFMLRQSSAPNQRRFQFLSECYVHGVMDGEVINNQESSHLEKFMIE
jgi:hypothetical protein